MHIYDLFLHKRTFIYWFPWQTSSYSHSYYNHYSVMVIYLVHDCCFESITVILMFVIFLIVTIYRSYFHHCCCYCFVLLILFWFLLVLCYCKCYCCHYQSHKFSLLWVFVISVLLLLSLLLDTIVIVIVWFGAWRRYKSDGKAQWKVLVIVMIVCYIVVLAWAIHIDHLLQRQSK